MVIVAQCRDRPMPAKNCRYSDWGVTARRVLLCSSLTGGPPRTKRSQPLLSPSRAERWLSSLKAVHEQRPLPDLPARRRSPTDSTTSASWRRDVTRRTIFFPRPTSRPPYLLIRIPYLPPQPGRPRQAPYFYPRLGPWSGVTSGCRSPCHRAQPRLGPLLGERAVERRYL